MAAPALVLLVALLSVGATAAAAPVELGIISMRAIWPGEVPYSPTVAALFTDCTVATFQAQNLAANATVALASSAPVTNATVPASSGAFRNPESALLSCRCGAPQRSLCWLEDTAGGRLLPSLTGSRPAYRE